MRLPASFGALLTWATLLTSVAAQDCPSPGLKRVVGYYEGVAMRRRCERLNPEVVPRRVFTHLIFAHADIEPETFEVRPHAYDPPLYDRIALVKLANPGMKLYIGLGGPSLNGPSIATFSEIAQSPENQVKFARSLINFMESFGFDGVDIDWQHPAEANYGGIAEDFDNYPEWLRRLRQHLFITGRGLSIAAPVASYRQKNFDLRRLSDNVDFINLKSYDLKSTVDFPDHWDGPVLSAHTNLTEINAGIDLILKDGVRPDKLVLGLAAYGRGYVPIRNDCLEPGCEYASPIPWSHCNDQGGVRFYREILKTLGEVRDQPGTNIAHYEKEAVKVLAWGEESKQWIAYDDEETILAKAEYARDKCLNGVALWALSHDTQDSGFAEALQSVTPLPEAPEMPPTRSLRENPALREEYEANRQAYFAQVSKLQQDIAPTSYEQLDMSGAACLSGKFHTVQAGDTCDSLAEKHAFASADLVRGNRGAISDCAALPVGAQLCLPASCAVIHVLKEGDTCDLISHEHRGEIARFGAVELHNNWLGPDCGNLHTASDAVFGHVLCLSPRGGKSTVKPRRFEEFRHGVVWVEPLKGVPIAPGTTGRCGGWYIAALGDTCTSLTLVHHIPISDLLEANPSLGEFEGCSGRIVVGSAYCAMPLVGFNRERTRVSDEL